MVRLRAEKIARVSNDIPDVEVFGKPQGKLLVVGWGGTYGAITTAVEHLQQRGRSISSIHLRYLNPFPKNLGEILRRFETILVPELNLGQLVWMLRAQFLLDAKGYNKVQGMPFKISELVNKFSQLL
jgi:2-oxoglutarate ferredoxin oxidoreductase subunit alpha